MKTGCLAAAAVLSSALAAYSGTARAAPAPACQPATMSPGTSLSIPANLAGFVYGASSAPAGAVHLYAVAGATKSEIPVTVGAAPAGWSGFGVTPASALTPGSSYELDFDPACNSAAYGSESLDFTAAPSAPFPTTIGDFATSPAPAAQVFDTSFQLSATMTLSDEMKPWGAVYMYSLSVDGSDVDGAVSFEELSNGAEIPLTSPVPQGHTVDRVTISVESACATINASSTQHYFALNAKLPFEPTLTTLTQGLVFECPVPVETGPGEDGEGDDVGVDPGGNPGTSSSSSSGSSPASGGSGSHGSTFACGVSRVASGASSLALIATALGLALVLRLRRRASAATTRR